MIFGGHGSLLVAASPDFHGDQRLGGAGDSIAQTPLHRIAQPQRNAEEVKAGLHDQAKAKGSEAGRRRRRSCWPGRRGNCPVEGALTGSVGFSV